jgi:hypothetical protein
MKKLLVICFLLISFLGFGQSVSAPDSKSFTPSTNGQDASGFVLSGFSPTATLLASISLVNPPTGTTFNLTTITGLTAASGFTLSGNKTRLVVTGTMANINNALSSLKVNTGSIRGNVQISVAATVNPAGFFYNGTNGHFYRPISSGTTYTNARAAALNTSFKGQQGYLVTITSADEDQFIFNNVPQSNIWFALTDEIVEGRWVIDAGPERGTVIKTSNGQFTGNIVGQYNNWASGEPNDWGGNEDYAVTKWNGSQWNDLGNGHNNPYVIEYGTWTNPDDATFTEFYTNSVIHSNGDVLRAQFNFDFGPNVDETRFSATLLAQSNNQYLPTTNTNRTLNGLGRVDMTSDLDTIKISSGGIRATTTTGEVEWCVIYEYDGFNQRYRVGIDKREFDGTGVSPTGVTSLKLFDLWDGNVTFDSEDIYWANYWIYTPTQLNFAGSSFSSFIRAGNGFYGVRAEFAFTPIQTFKPHGVQLSTTNNMSSLYNSIVTVSDVFLAFKELSNSGLFGNESGLELSNGIQFMNADVDGNGVFNEMDTYKLLQHLTGTETIGGGSNNLSDYIKLYTKSEYDNITKTNWYTQTNITRNQYTPLNLSNSTLLNNFNLNVSWIGDVNLSHSAQQSVSGVSGNSIRSMSLMTNSTSTEINASIMGEISNDKVIVTISVDPLQQEVVGTQFQLNYDNTKLKFEKVDFVTIGNPMNYGTNRGSFISIGSLITSGNGVLDKNTEYKVVFTPIGDITDILGLTSVSTTDAVNKDGKQLKVKLN